MVPSLPLPWTPPLLIIIINPLRLVFLLFGVLVVAAVSVLLCLAAMAFLLAAIPLPSTIIMGGCLGQAPSLPTILLMQGRPLSLGGSPIIIILGGTVLPWSPKPG